MAVSNGARTKRWATAVSPTSLVFARLPIRRAPTPPFSEPTAGPPPVLYLTYLTGAVPFPRQRGRAEKGESIDTF